MQTAIKHENILIIGGGDGMALREVLKYEDVGKVTLVDLDPAVTKLFAHNENLASLNHNSLSSKKLTIVNQDAWKYIDASTSLYDVIIVDLPDPNNLSIGRLYSETFYRILSSHLSRAGAMVTQSTSPMYSHKAFWCIEQTIQASELITTPYHTYIPSFGEWGFVMGTKLKLPTKDMSSTMQLKYINNNTFNTMKIFDKDMAKVPVETNRLSSHKLIYYYDKGWGKWYAN
jgi:spermidine synthase